MATYYGAAVYDGAEWMRLRIDVTDTGWNSSTTSVNVSAWLYFETRYSVIDSNNQFWFNGGYLGARAINHGSSGGLTQIASGTWAVAIGYGVVGYISFSGQVQGIEAVPGTAIINVTNYGVGPRPPNIPSAPAAPTISNITATSARASWSAPASNGASIDQYQIQVDDVSSFASPLHTLTDTASPNDFGSLTRVTQYWVRVRAHNSVGWSAWSAAVTFTTSATPPDQPVAPVISNIQADRATMAFTAPNNGGSAISSFETQMSSVANFASIAASANIPQASSGTWTPTTLQPGTNYYARYRAHNSAGASAWSPAVTFQTLSGAKVLVSGTWRQCRLRVLDVTVWRLVRANKRISGLWRL